MFKAVANLLKKPETLHAEIGLDHVEICQENLILGLQLAWFNHTPAPLEIREVVIQLYHEGKNKAPIPLIYNGRFVRIPFQKGITKINGATSFYLKPGSHLVESLRFLSRDIHDLADGTYHGELHSFVAEGAYLHDFSMKVVPQLKSRDVPEKNQPGTSAPSTAYARALRLGA
jgi:hypothetical protein